jgi:hypothetical protein
MTATKRITNLYYTDSIHKNPREKLHSLGGGYKEINREID